MVWLPRWPLAITGLIFLPQTVPVTAMVSVGRPGSGFIGVGIDMYQPVCAYACKSSISSHFDCDQDHSMADMHMAGMVRRMDMGMEMPSPECYASNGAFLQTLAYCMSTHCQNVNDWELERYWQLNVAGRAVHQPEPKYTYQAALAMITRAPNRTTSADELLLDVSIVDEDTYLANYNGDDTFQHQDARHSRYGLALLISGFLVPVAFSLLRFVPFPQPLASRFNAVFVYPPLFGSQHDVPWFKTAIMPTRGQSLMLAYVLGINIILCAVGYRTSTPNSWYSTTSEQVVSYIANRTGVLSAANLGLLISYAGRNNLLLTLTDWSHSTFLLLHRWVAAICVVQACIHSAIYLRLYSAPDSGSGSEAKLTYWIWGVISTLSMTILLPLSILQFRQKLYELFLALHVVFAFFACIGYYYHIICRFERQWGYETWVYIAFAIWAFDRVVRLLRIVRNGVCHAHVTVIDDDYIRLDVPGVSASGHAYLYFPTLTWRVWENHPFSIASSFTGHQNGAPPVSGHEKRLNTEDLDQKGPANFTTDPTDSNSSLSTTSAQAGAPAVGMTLFVRTHTGLTRLLRSRKTVPVLVESSYGHGALGGHGNDIVAQPNLICIAGGVGITALIPLLASHTGRKKLYWGVRSQPLVEALHDTLDSAVSVGTAFEVSVGSRMDLTAILSREIQRTGAGNGISVIVSGPPEMADEVRVMVSKLAGSTPNAVVTFMEESYGW